MSIFKIITKVATIGARILPMVTDELGNTSDSEDSPPESLPLAQIYNEVAWHYNAINGKIYIANTSTREKTIAFHTAYGPKAGNSTIFTLNGGKQMDVTTLYREHYAGACTICDQTFVYLGEKLEDSYRVSIGQMEPIHTPIHMIDKYKFIQDEENELLYLESPHPVKSLSISFTDTTGVRYDLPMYAASTQPARSYVQSPPTKPKDYILKDFNLTMTIPQMDSENNFEDKTRRTKNDDNNTRQTVEQQSVPVEKDTEWIEFQEGTESHEIFLEKNIVMNRAGKAILGDSRMNESIPFNRSKKVTMSLSYMTDFRNERNVPMIETDYAVSPGAAVVISEGDGRTHSGGRLKFQIFGY